jgi:hypothetical protein
MTPARRAKQAGRSWSAVVVVAVAGALLFSSTARGVAQQFLASLRIARPRAVGASVPGAGGSSRTRQLQNLIGGMLSRRVDVVLDEADRPATTIDAASKLAGFPAHLPRARSDRAEATVLGAHAIDMTVDVGQLQTIFAEAGRRDVQVPPAVNGSKVAIRTPRAIRVQYGSCPAPVANTIQGQLQGPPPPSTDNANCIVLVEGPAVSADVPPALDMGPLLEIALELSGMSPAEARAVPQTLDWKAILTASLPRNLRSFEMKEVNGAPAMLLVTAGRRGPTWELLWAKGSLVYALTGYANAGDAVPLASSVN